MKMILRALIIALVFLNSRSIAGTSDAAKSVEKASSARLHSASPEHRGPKLIGDGTSTFSLVALGLFSSVALSIWRITRREDVMLTSLRGLSGK